MLSLPASASAGEQSDQLATAPLQDSDGLQSGPTGSSDAALPPAPAAAATWTSEDETTLQALLARRKAAGFQRRGQDVSGQVIRAGTTKPNDGTVVATIVSLVEARGTVTRGELIQLMADTAFPYAKAKPDDAAWCQGYIAGAIRSGFLTVHAAAAATEA
jgi:hypothetical protein